MEYPVKFAWVQIVNKCFQFSRYAAKRPHSSWSTALNALKKTEMSHLISLKSGNKYIWRKLSMAIRGKSDCDFPKWPRGWENFSPSAVRKLTVSIIEEKSTFTRSKIFGRSAPHFCLLKAAYEFHPCISVVIGDHHFCGTESKTVGLPLLTPAKMTQQHWLWHCSTTRFKKHILRRGINWYFGAGHKSHVRWSKTERELILPLLSTLWGTICQPTRHFWVRSITEFQQLRQIPLINRNVLRTLRITKDTVEHLMHFVYNPARTHSSFGCIECSA